MKCSCGGTASFYGLSEKNGIRYPTYKCGCGKTFIDRNRPNKPPVGYQNAVKLYEDFNMKPAESVLTANLSLPNEKNPLVHLGKISGIIYISDKEGKKGQQYIHETEPPYPDFFVTADGKTFIMAGGKMVVKDGWLYY